MRTLSRLRVLPLLLSSAVLALSGCSVAGAFNKSAAPIAARVSTDFERYNAAEPDVGKQASNTALLGSFNQAVDAGDIEGTAVTWFGPTRLRDTYTGYLVTDTRFAKPGGQILLQGKKDMLSDFDLIIATGRKASASPPTPSPPR